MKKSVGWEGFIPVAALALMAMYVVRITDRSSNPVRAGSQAKVVRHEPPAVLVGREGRVESGKAAWIPLFGTHAKLSRFAKATAIHDKYDVAGMLLQRDTFAVERGTRIQVIETGFLVARVRVLEGEQEGNAGWLPSEMVRVTQ